MAIAAYNVTLELRNPEEARKQLAQACKKLLGSWAEEANDPADEHTLAACLSFVRTLEVTAQIVIRQPITLTSKRISAEITALQVADSKDGAPIIKDAEGTLIIEHSLYGPTGRISLPDAEIIG